MRILLAEDDGAVATLLRDRFRLCGHDVTHFDNGESAWEALRASPRGFDVAVLDVMLPKLNGWDLCKRMKADEGVRDLPVLILTAKKLAPDELMSYEAGAEEYMAKPFDFKELLAAALRLSGPGRA